MKGRKEVFNSLAGTVTRFIKRMGKEKGITRKFEGSSTSSMSRVTDQFGNEYLCPVRSLKDPSFVSESEKSRCFDYDYISKTYVS